MTVSAHPIIKEWMKMSSKCLTSMIWRIREIDIYNSNYFAYVKQWWILGNNLRVTWNVNHPKKIHQSESPIPDLSIVFCYFINLDIIAKIQTIVKPTKYFFHLYFFLLERCDNLSIIVHPAAITIYKIGIPIIPRWLQAVKGL